MTEQPQNTATAFRSTDIEELIGALVKAQAGFQPLKKTNTAVVHSKRTGKTHSYNYASLPDVNEACDPSLQENGLAVIQTTEAGMLITTLAHTSGQFIAGEMPIPPELAPHDLGSWLTYLRRYAKCAIIGVAAEEDDDAGVAQAGHKDKGSTSSAPPPATDQPRQMDEIPNPFTGFVDNVESFKGEKDGKPWTRYHIQARSGQSDVAYEFRTFSDTHADVASGAKKDHRSVVIEFTLDKFGRKVKTLDIGNEDDVPF